MAARLLVRYRAPAHLQSTEKLPSPYPWAGCLRALSACLAGATSGQLSTEDERLLRGERLPVTLWSQTTKEPSAAQTSLWAPVHGCYPGRGDSLRWPGLSRGHPQRAVQVWASHPSPESLPSWPPGLPSHTAVPSDVVKNKGTMVVRASQSRARGKCPVKVVMVRVGSGGTGQEPLAHSSAQHWP